jgi:polyphosphate kinase
MVDQQFRCWREELVPQLAKNNIHFLHPADLDKADRAWLDNYYNTQVRPVLTPLGIDPSHPFPQLLNKSLNIAVHLEIERNGVVQRRLAVAQVPRVLPRLVKMPHADDRRDYLFMGQIIGHYLADIFPGTNILGFWHFRVTRNSELYIDEEDTGNLLNAVEHELHNRLRGAGVRLEVDHDCPPEICQDLLTRLELGEDDLYIIDGPLNPIRLMAIYEGDHSTELRDKPFHAPAAPAFRHGGEIFKIIRQRDVLVHHPYESYSCVVEFLEAAARDPNVLAIKQTLYRTGGDPRVVGALMDAVRNGKQVTAVTELKARFDEANNIAWAKQLEEAGVHVVYGIVHHKVHSKVALVVRRDDDALRCYVHLGTGNYNPSTARVYTDLSFFTCQKDFSEDVTNLFNLLTGLCQFQPTRKLLVAPFTLHPTILALIKRETANAEAGKPARIIAKMNALVDPDIIVALYAASRAGVKIDLIVRGVCCLRPGLPDVSENITVRSIVGRFLEHSRISYFENGGEPKLYIGSADWMPRNFFRRIETVMPVEEPGLRDQVNQILATQLADNTKAWTLNADGTYLRPARRDGKGRNSQAEFMAIAQGAPAARKKQPIRERFPTLEVAPPPTP